MTKPKDPTLLYPPTPGKKKTVKLSGTAPREIRHKERMAIALDFRIQGLSYRKIAGKMNTDQGTAFRLVDDAIRAITREKAEQVLSLELERLDMMQEAVFDKAREGNETSINTVLKISERRGKLEGIDQVPAGTNVNINTQGDGVQQTVIVKGGLPADDPQRPQEPSPTEELKQ